MVGTRISGEYAALRRRLVPAEVLVRGERIETVSPRPCVLVDCAGETLQAEQRLMYRRAAPEETRVAADGIRGP